MYNFLNESIITDELTYSLSKVFKKIDIYSRNRNLAALNEAQYGRYNRNIRLTKDEQKSVKTLFMMMEHAGAESIINEYGLEIEYTELNEGKKIDSVKKKLAQAKDWTKEKIEKTKEGLDKLKNIKEFFAVLLKKAVDSIEKFIQLLVSIFSKLADSVQEAVHRLIGSVNSEKIDSTLPNNEITSEFQEEDKGFLSLVYDYLVNRIQQGPEALEKINLFSSDIRKPSEANESKYFPKQNRPSLNEAWFSRKKEEPEEQSEKPTEEPKEYKNAFDKFVHTNKAFQWIIGYRPGGGKIKWWKSILASIVGSIIFTLIIPAFLTVCLGSGPTVTMICFAIQIIWGTKGVCKVLLARYTSKTPEEKFWNRPTAIAFCIAVAFLIIPRIPAVREWMAEGIRNFLEWSGLDKRIDNIEDWFRNLLGWVKSEKDVVVRYEKISDHLEKYVPKSGKGTIDPLYASSGLNPSSKAADVIDVLKHSNGHMSDNMRNGLINLQKLANSQVFKNSISMDHFMPGKLHADNAAYMFDFSRALGPGGKFEGKNAVWLCNWLKERLESKGINGAAIPILNDQLRDQTHSLGGSVIAYATDIPVTQGADFEGIFADIAKEAGIAGDATNSIGVLLNDLNDTTAVEEIVSKPIHMFTDFIANNFAPMFFPMFSHKGEWCAVYPGDPNRYPIVDRKEMTYEELDSISPRDDGASWNMVARKQRAARRKELMERIEAAKEKKKNGGFKKGEWNPFVKELKKEIAVYNNFKPAECKVLVFFTTGKFYKLNESGESVKESLNNSLLAPHKKEKKLKYYNKFNLFEGSDDSNRKDIYDNPIDDDFSFEPEQEKWTTVELKHTPLFAWNPYILYHADLNEITMNNLRSNKTEWLMRGLFKAHMKIEPLKVEKNKDPYASSTGREIKKKINTIFDSMIKTAANAFGMDKIAYVKDEKYIPKHPDKADKNIKLMGNFKPNELCRIWNKEDSAWKYLWINDETTDNPVPNPVVDPGNTNIVPNNTISTALVRGDNSSKDLVKTQGHKSDNSSHQKQLPTSQNLTIRKNTLPDQPEKRPIGHTKDGAEIYRGKAKPKSQKYKGVGDYYEGPIEEIPDESMIAPHKLLAPHKKK